MRKDSIKSSYSNSDDQLVLFFGTLEREIAGRLLNNNDPVLNDTLDILGKLGNRIATFFMRIRELIQRKTQSRETTFVVDYFQRNYSIISENARSSQKILQYSMNRLDWLKDHSERIIESMKNLYANLLSIQLDCEQLYEDFFNKALEFDFGLKAYDEFQEVRQFLTLEKAFEVLGIDQEATRDEIKNAFRRLAKKLHPDINPEADLREFILTEKAYKLALNRDTTHKTLA